MDVAETCYCNTAANWLQSWGSVAQSCTSRGVGQQGTGPHFPTREEGPHDPTLPVFQQRRPTPLLAHFQLSARARLCAELVLVGAVRRKELMPRVVRPIRVRILEFSGSNRAGHFVRGELPPDEEESPQALDPGLLIVWTVTLLPLPILH